MGLFMSRIRAQPLPLSLPVLGFFLLGLGFLVGPSSSSSEALALVAALHASNACISSDAGVRRNTSPRFRYYHHYC